MKLKILQDPDAHVRLEPSFALDVGLDKVELTVENGQNRATVFLTPVELSILIGQAKTVLASLPRPGGPLKPRTVDVRDFGFGRVEGADETASIQAALDAAFKLSEGA